jgi:hypothetical protein
MNKARLLIAVLGLAALTGCATSRSVITPSVTAGQNPVQGQAVRIESVRDARTFEPRPPRPSLPSLNAEDVNNAALTARAVGRKRNGFGQALGDIVLPEGESVAKLVGTALTKGLRESGYRVLSKGEAGYEQAVPVTAQVDQFWSWINPGFASIKTSGQVDVAMGGGLKPLAGKKVTAEVTESHQIVTENDWAVILNKALDAWIANLKTALRP